MQKYKRVIADREPVNKFEYVQTCVLGLDEERIISLWLQDHRSELTDAMRERGIGNYNQAFISKVYDLHFKPEAAIKFADDVFECLTQIRERPNFFFEVVSDYCMELQQWDDTDQYIKEIQGFITNLCKAENLDNMSYWVYGILQTMMAYKAEVQGVPTNNDQIYNITNHLFNALKDGQRIATNTAFLERTSKLRV